MCWTTWKTIWIPAPALFRPLLIFTKKKPSPDVNPATHSGLGILGERLLNLGTGTVRGKAAFKT